MSRPFRYTFILGLVAFATALAALGGWRYARASAPVNGPIVLVSVDSLRADRLPAYGYRNVKTPAIDTLAADGVVFDRAYAQVPLTLPAHASLLTGRLPFETGVRDNLGFVLSDDERLISEMLRDRGFATGAVVSSYLLRKDTGIAQGFTFFDGELPPVDSSDPTTILESLQRSSLDAEQAAEHWLNTAGTSRLFLFLHLDDSDADDQVSDAGVTASYDQRVVSADAAIGRLIRYLKTHQLYDRSTIILVADHGEGLGDHGEQSHGVLVYDEALRVPLVIKQAAGEGAGRRVADLVQQVDLVPTILDLAKAPGADNLSGRSLKPLLDGSSRFEPRSVYSESLYALYHFGWSGLTSVTDGRYRYIDAPREELYDLTADPAQRRNLIADAPATILDNLRRELKRFTERAKIAEPSLVDADVRDHIEALGNVGRQAAAPEQVVPVGPPAPRVDPKDRIGLIEQYREAVRLGAARHWSRAMDLLRGLIRQEPDRVDLLTLLADYATDLGTTDQAVTAYRRIITLDPGNAEARLGLARQFLASRKPAEALEQASLVDSDDFAASSSNRLAARTMIVEIALARREGDRAREEAVSVKEADSRLPIAEYVEARLLFDRGQLEEAIPFFEQALAAADKAPGGAGIDRLDYYYGETLSRLKRFADAEQAYLRAIAAAPNDIRARAALAVVYRKTGKLADAESQLMAMTRVAPAPETYRLAASLWSAFGNDRQAAAVRAEGQRLTSAQPQPGRTQ